MHSPQNHALQKNNHEILIISYLELQLSQMMPPSLAQRLAEDAHKQHNESWFLPGHRQSLTSCGRTTAASRTRDTSWSPPVPVPCPSTSTMPRLAPPYRANGSVFAIKEMLLGSTHSVLKTMCCPTGWAALLLLASNKQTLTRTKYKEESMGNVFSWGFVWAKWSAPRVFGSYSVRDQTQRPVACKACHSAEIANNKK